MTNTYCDLCQRTVDEADLRYIRFEESDGTQKHKYLEICAICMEDVYHKILHKEITNAIAK